MGTRISDLTAAGTFTGAELVPVTQSGVTVKATSSQFKTTNASDLTSGTVAAARLPAATTSIQGAVILGTSAGTACEGNDSRLSDSRNPSGTAGGDLTGTYPNPTLTASGATAGTYGSSSYVPQIQVDAKGRITSVSSVPISGTAGGTVTSVDVSGGDTGLLTAHGPITGDGTIILAGVLNVTSGGTNASTATAARSNLSAAKSGANTDITSVALTTGTVSTAPSAGTDIANKAYVDGKSSGVVSFSAGTTGFTPNVATSGIITLGGTLAVTNGGTGATSQVGALTSLGAQPLITVLPVANGGTGASTSTGSGSVVLATSPTVATPTINGYTEGLVAIGTVGSTQTLAITAGTVLTATLTSATACTFTMPSVGAGKAFTLYLKQPASGTATTAAFTGVKWPAATAPTITAAVGKMDILSFVSDGTSWFGSFIQNFTY